MRHCRSTSALLLSPSRGFGGGIERLIDALAEAWPEPTQRVDLYVGGRDRRAHANVIAKMRFIGRAVLTAVLCRPQRIICLHIGLLPVARLVGTVMRSPVTLVAYGTEVWAPMSWRQRRLVGRCSSLLAISSFTAQWFAARAGVVRERITVLPVAIASTLAEEAERPLPLTREPVVLTVGRVAREHRYKGHRRIADAWPLVLRDRPDARWVVIGDGDDVDAIADHCRRLGIDSTVELRRSLSDEDLASAYRCACAMVLPSVADVHARPPTGEGFGLVYAEAAAFCVPSIAAIHGGGAADIVEDGLTGLTVDPTNARALADAILTLLDDEVLRARLGAAARRRVLERHLPGHFAECVRGLDAP
jgi:phosphatidyl-myo-inositol dimannoside synthase